MTQSNKHPEELTDQVKRVLDDQDARAMTLALNTDPSIPESEVRASTESDESPKPGASIRDEEDVSSETVEPSESEGAAGTESLQPREAESSSKAEKKTAKRRSNSKKPMPKPRRGRGTDATIADSAAELPTNVPIDGDFNSYSEFLLRLNPFAMTVNRANIHLAWLYGEALNALLASPHYNRGDYTKLLAAIEMSCTKAHCVRQVAGRWRLHEALKRKSYSDLLREMGYLPDREPRKGESRGVGDRDLDAVDPPDEPEGIVPSEDDDGRGVPGKKKKTGKTKRNPKGGRPALSVTHENVLLRLEEIKAQAIKIKTMNPPNVELADATALYDRMRSELVEIIRVLRDVHDIADNWIVKNGSYSPPTEGGE